MQIPLVCFVTYNRLGASAINLKALLDTKSDFELIIIDNASIDGTWEFIETLNDPRIKLKHRFSKNYGIVFAANYGISKRKKDQAYILVENDIFIDDKNWIEKFQKTLSTFPHLGLIGAVTKEYLEEKIINYSQMYVNKILEYKNNNKNKLDMIPETKDGTTIYYKPYIPGSCIYLPSNTLDIIGYWNEETCGADNEIGRRINLFTPNFTAITTELFIKARPSISCNECIAKQYCKYDNPTNSNCYWRYKKKTRR